MAFSFIGIGRLIADAKVTPIVLPIFHIGEFVYRQNLYFNPLYTNEFFHLVDTMNLECVIVHINGSQHRIYKLNF